VRFTGSTLTFGVAGAMVREYPLLAVLPTLSVTVTVKEKLPAAVGAPVSVPPGDRFRPGGSAPPVTA
jgi:hypothetical protein